MKDLLEATEGSPLLVSAEATERNESRSEQINFALNSFCAVLYPVSATMFLSSVVVACLQSPSSTQDLNVYTVYTASADDSSSMKLLKSFANSGVIVGVLAITTFVIVGLYKFRFMGILIAYMVLSSTMLLGVMGGTLWKTVLDKYQLPCDIISYGIASYNFAGVGVIAIFYQQGVPSYLTQAYLVATSVLMAWQLSKFDEWTGWCLLVSLAAYDLCAVLTPCGPLKALVNLMQQQDAPPMPGLLYEATLPSDAKLGHASFADHSPSRDKSPPRHHSTASSEVKDDEKSIKLGLGDFVFYSVLVSKAALYGFTTCAVCFLVIILGLGITLALLSVYRVALPALPISIALGVAFYLLAREASVPLLEATSARPIYF